MVENEDTAEPVVDMVNAVNETVATSDSKPTPVSGQQLLVFNRAEYLLFALSFVLFLHCRKLMTSTFGCHSLMLL